MRAMSDAYAAGLKRPPLPIRTVSAPGLGRVN